MTFEKMAFAQFARLRMKVLPKFGFKNNFIQTGLEADDIIAAIVQNYEPPEKFIIVSSDNDLYQLLSPTVSMFSNKSKKMMTVESFTKKWGIAPELWPMVKQIAGCTSDTVKGVVGIGEKKAIQFLLGTLKEHTKGYKSIIDGKDIIDRNEALVVLPFKGTKVPNIVEEETFYLANFIEITDEYGFRSFQQIESLDQWVTQFGMI